MKKFLSLTVVLFSLNLLAKQSTKNEAIIFEKGKTNVSYNIEALTKGSRGFVCHIGKYKIINLSYKGSFKKFSLEGEGIMINSYSADIRQSRLTKDIVLMVPSSNEDIKEGKYISVDCMKSLSAGGSPFTMDFYVLSDQ